MPETADRTPTPAELRALMDEAGQKHPIGPVILSPSCYDAMKAEGCNMRGFTREVEIPVA